MGWKWVTRIWEEVKEWAKGDWERRVEFLEAQAAEMKRERAILRGMVLEKDEKIKGFEQQLEAVLGRLTIVEDLRLKELHARITMHDQLATELMEKFNVVLTTPAVGRNSAAAFRLVRQVEARQIEARTGEKQQ